MSVSDFAGILPITPSLIPSCHVEDFKSSILDLNRLHFSANSVTTYFLIFGKVLVISCVPCGRWINIHRALTDECVEVSAEDTKEN